MVGTITTRTSSASHAATMAATTTNDATGITKPGSKHATTNDDATANDDAASKGPTACRAYQS